MVSRTLGVMAVLALLLSGTPGATAVDPITRWGAEAAEATAAAGMAPLRTPITFAILHLAMYDAVNTVAGGSPPYQVSTEVKRPASAEAAAIAAGYRVLLAELPSQHSRLGIVYRQLLETVADLQAQQNGVLVGEEVARRLLAIRADDGRDGTIAYQAGSGPGAWLPTPPGFLAVTTASLARVRPFTMESPMQFRPAGPPALGSEQWARDYNEVRALGALTGSTRTPEQTATAWFWEPIATTVWPASIRRLAAEHGLNLESSARFQAAAFAAFADGLIACWDAKFAFNTWRPVTAIHAAERAADWQPLAVTPNFPEYPSGHACVTAAVAHTVEHFFNRSVPIPARNVVTGEERVYRTAADVVNEVVEARMLLGVHFRAADEDAADMGRKIARQIGERWFTRR